MTDYTRFFGKVALSVGMGAVAIVATPAVGMGAGLAIFGAGVGLMNNYIWKNQDEPKVSEIKTLEKRTRPSSYGPNVNQAWYMDATRSTHSHIEPYNNNPTATETVVNTVEAGLDIVGGVTGCAVNLGLDVATTATACVVNAFKRHRRTEVELLNEYTDSIKDRAVNKSWYRNNKI